MWLRFGGMLLRALEGELAVGDTTPAIRTWTRELTRTYDGWCAEAEAGAAHESIPIRHLVCLQYGAVLAGAGHAPAGTMTRSGTARAPGRSYVRRARERVSPKQVPKEDASEAGSVR
ncbi:hypothetical protein FE391_42125 [Nonomuraea sp. KC401]|uniref:hypothetical protein n=1 Tax=unclassified Nonomuraea TaxID=2593643 RepID=UPI0010FD24F4|nr:MULTISPECIES: hypothetical protein [unclassified Nonomuraea]NBE99268.1 hypothetical protein [Nonomuraea sp. K271]TLF54212.1 hypothetical protein FE391_42125 [Nonomuraea sp. KC401]